MLLIILLTLFSPIKSQLCCDFQPALYQASQDILAAINAGGGGGGGPSPAEFAYYTSWLAYQNGNFQSRVGSRQPGEAPFNQTLSQILMDLEWLFHDALYLNLAGPYNNFSTSQMLYQLKTNQDTQITRLNSVIAALQALGTPLADANLLTQRYGEADINQQNYIGTRIGISKVGGPSQNQSLAQTLMDIEYFLSYAFTNTIPADNYTMHQLTVSIKKVLSDLYILLDGTQTRTATLPNQGYQTTSITKGLTQTLTDFQNMMVSGVYASSDNSTIAQNIKDSKTLLNSVNDGIQALVDTDDTPIPPPFASVQLVFQSFRGLSTGLRTVKSTVSSLPTPRYWTFGRPDIRVSLVTKNIGIALTSYCPDCTVPQYFHTGSAIITVSNNPPSLSNAIPDQLNNYINLAGVMNDRTGTGKLDAYVGQNPTTLSGTDGANCVPGDLPVQMVYTPEAPLNASGFPTKKYMILLETWIQVGDSATSRVSTGTYRVVQGAYSYQSTPPQDYECISKPLACDEFDCVCRIALCLSTSDVFSPSNLMRTIIFENANRLQNGLTSTENMIVATSGRNVNERYMVPYGPPGLGALVSAVKSNIYQPGITSISSTATGNTLRIAICQIGTKYALAMGKVLLPIDQGKPLTSVIGSTRDTPGGSYFQQNLEVVWDKNYDAFAQKRIWEEQPIEIKLATNASPLYFIASELDAAWCETSVTSIRIPQEMWQLDFSGLTTL